MIISITLMAISARAEKVEFSDDELATESVLPVFDQPSTVKKRNVSVAHHIDFGASLGVGVNEAFFDMALIGFSTTYHFSEYSGIQFVGSYLSTQSSQFVGKINDVGAPPKANLQYLPPPRWYALIDYQFTPYYGKLSLTKQTVINQSLYLTGGVGIVNINGEENSFALEGGLGQNYYFSPHWGLNLDFRGLLFQGPDPLSANLGSDTKTASVSRFSKETDFNIAITVGVLFLP